MKDKCTQCGCDKYDGGIHTSDNFGIASPLQRPGAHKFVAPRISLWLRFKIALFSGEGEVKDLFR